MYANRQFNLLFIAFSTFSQAQDFHKLNCASFKRHDEDYNLYSDPGRNVVLADQSTTTPSVQPSTFISPLGINTSHISTVCLAFQLKFAITPYVVCFIDRQTAAMCDITLGFSTPPTGWSCSSLGSLCTSWDGISCSSGYVTSISSFFADLHGTLSASIGQLTQLQFLSIQFAGLNGTIPTSMGMLTDLTYLDFSFNIISGSIPTQVGAMKQLTGFFLLANTLTGSVPTELYSLSYLTSLDIGFNRLSSSISPLIADLTNLQRLSISSNSFTGLYISKSTIIFFCLYIYVLYT